MHSHHHQHLRKRNRSLEPYPAKSYSMRVLDGIVYTVGVLGPIFTLPQIFKIYIGQDASSISALTWGTYALFNIPWIIYGYAHNERPISITYALWFIVNSTVFLGALLYGN